MSFIVENKGISFEKCPPGLHLARCYRIVDVGTQKSEYIKGQVKYQHKIMLAWEIHGQNDDGGAITMADGRPFAVFRHYTLSWSDRASLRIDLQSWRGKPFNEEEMKKFDLNNILGAWCMLNVIEKPGDDGNVYSGINGVTPVPSMIKKSGFPNPINKNEIFNLSDPDLEMIKGFSENLKRKIESSPEWQKLSAPPIQGASLSEPEDDNSIPF